MARTKRLLSSTGIYHIMLRGNNKQSIFWTENDYRKFLYVLKDAKDKFGFELFAYCIMKNHLHLLLRYNDCALENIFKYIGARFVYWYNRTHDQSGHLFQGRFKSIPVENDEYFLTLFRYIHQNPVKANLCLNVCDYPYSSYNYYAHNTTEKLIDTYFAEELLDSSLLIELINEPLPEKTEPFSSPRLSDLQAIEIINKYVDTEIDKLSDLQLSELVKTLVYEGLSVRQIARLTNIKYSKIRYML